MSACACGHRPAAVSSTGLDSNRPDLTQWARSHKQHRYLLTTGEFVRTDGHADQQLSRAVYAVLPDLSDTR